jgi:hypothetical protein
MTLGAGNPIPATTKCKVMMFLYFKTIIIPKFWIIYKTRKTNDRTITLTEYTLQEILA